MGARYRLARRLASDGVAEVFLGVASGAAGERPVALKRVSAALSPEARRQFFADAQLARGLVHPNLVGVVDVGRGAEGLVLAMELVDGWSLRTLRERGREVSRPFPPALAAWIVAQVNAGLMHGWARAYELRGVQAAHGDVSDAKVLVSREGEVKLAAAGFDRHAVVSTRFRYAAPELVAGGDATQDSDMFALGVLFHELLTGVAPWGECATVDAYVRRVGGPPSELSRVPEPLRALVARMIEHEPLVRIGAPELADALAGLFASTGEPHGAPALAAFVQTLSPPPSPLELPPDARADEDTAPFELQPEAAPTGPAETFDPFAEGAPAGEEHGFRMERFESLGWEPREAPAAREARVEDIFPGSADGELELAREVIRPAPLVPFDYGHRRSFPWRKWLKVSVLSFTALGIVGFGLWYEWPNVSRAISNTFPEVFPGRTIAVLRVDSSPPGAVVRVDDAIVGMTPLLLENLYPKRTVTIDIEREGYLPWSGEFPGGQSAEVDVVLHRKRTSDNSGF